MKEIRPKLWYDYLKYLMRDVGFNKKEHYNLLKQLHDMEFTWADEVKMDRNRASDGEYLRIAFFRDLGIRDGDFEYPCSVLEMLVALAKRIGEELISPIGSDGKEHIDYIFEMFLVNLGVSEVTSSADVIEIISFWMDRMYGDDGIGSIFYLPYDINGFKNEEIWRQTYIFLTENGVTNVSDLEKFL